MASVKDYYYITKPGIIRGNALATFAGFLLASKGHLDVLLLAATLAGASLIIASGCVFNNYIDRGIDKKMARTKRRALITGVITGRVALLYGTLLGLCGFAILGLFTNMLTVIVGVVGWFSYVVLYGIWKRRSIHGTLVGSISGAVPPLAGYVAVSGKIDGAAVLLVLLLVAWQMPHFYAIAIYRLKDYRAAGIPVLPSIKGFSATRKQIIAYIIAYGVVAALFTILGYTGIIYLISVVVLSILWLRRGFKPARNEVAWARSMFGFSLIVLSAQCLLLSINAWLP